MPKRQSLAEALKETTAPQRPSRPERPPEGATRVISGHFAAEAHRQLRMLAASEDRTLHDVLKEALNNLFASRSLPPIA